MKNVFTKNWAFIGCLLAVLLDKSSGFVVHFVPDAFWQNFIYMLGTGMLGYFWTSKHNELVVKKTLRK